MSVLYKVILASYIVFNLGSASAQTCAKTCKDQCTVGWLGNVTEPTCYTACVEYQALACWDLNHPDAAIASEVGSHAYPAAASITKSRNSSSRELTYFEKSVLTRFFSRSMLDKVRVTFEAKLVEKWGNEPIIIQFSKSAAQTFGYNIYVSFKEDELRVFDRISLLAHELVHTRQYVQRNESFSTFGRDYFEGYAENWEYKLNPMEKEAEGMERVVLQSLAERPIRTDELPWTLEICNKTNAEKLYVAIARQKVLDGFSLVPVINSEGWYSLAKNECKTLVHNEGGYPTYYYATTSTRGGAGLQYRGEAEFCIHSTDAFEISRYTSCNEDGQYKVGFSSVTAPESLDNRNKKINLTGTLTSVEICNDTTERIDGSILRGDTTQFESGWRNVGWYTYEPSQCRTFNLNSTSNVYIYGKSQESEWNGEGRGGILSCVYNGEAFRVPHSQPCKGESILALEVDIKSGKNYFSYSTYDAVPRRPTGLDLSGGDGSNQPSSPLLGADWGTVHGSSLELGWQSGRCSQADHKEVYRYSSRYPSYNIDSSGSLEINCQDHTVSVFSQSGGTFYGGYDHGSQELVWFQVNFGYRGIRDVYWQKK